MERAPAAGDPVALGCIEAAGSDPAQRVWVLEGALVGDESAALASLLRRPLPPRGGRLTLDLTALSEVDSAGTALLLDLWRRGREQGFEVEVRGARPEVRRFLELYRVDERPEDPAPAPGALEAFGGQAHGALVSARDLLILAADVSVRAVSTLLRPWRLRWGALVEQSIGMGSRALGIVALITFLVGLTLAFQSAYQLRQFGAAIYVATLTAISTVREMGPLITAILVAGRSGAAITSEVATMKVNEEIDAIQVMGIPFLDFVAVPKLLALVAMLPLLTILADVSGILGGFVVAVAWLEIPPGAYLDATVEALVPKDLVTGLAKSVAFAWGIALIGLFHGVRVRGGAQEVGRATTNSVVSAIFFIIVADALFSILFYVVFP